MFTFTALLGARSTSKASQSILELDGGVKILIDVGWDDTFDSEQLKELERQIPTISVILLTHATTAHLGAYAHCCKNYPLFTRIPVYATTPVIQLGRTLLQDIYASTPLAATFIPISALSESAYGYTTQKDGSTPNILLQAPTAEEIVAYFSYINPLKYSQPHQPVPSPSSPSLNGLTITAYSAGHTLGGTIWHVQHGLESIVHAVDWNQAREHVLAGAAWLGGVNASAEVIEQLRRPTALICSSRGLEANIATQSGAEKEELLLRLIRETVSRGGKILIPSDSSARVLEVAYLLERAWSAGNDQTNPLRAAKLCLASKSCGSTMRLARTMIEWMEESIVRDFETASAAQAAKGHQRNRSQQLSVMNTAEDAQNTRAPFDFKHLKLVERKSQLLRRISSPSPAVIIASDASLEWGLSKFVLQQFSSDPRNLVILTERNSTNTSKYPTLGNSLWSFWRAETSNGIASPRCSISGNDFVHRSAELQKLAPAELSAYQQYVARRRQLQNVVQGEGTSALETSADVVAEEEESSSESEDSDVEHQGKILNISAQMTQSKHNRLGLSDAELGINVLTRRKGVHDYDVRGKRGREKMFPFTAKRRRGDDFGDAIRPEDYLRAEERDEIDGEDMRAGANAKDNSVGQKRSWADATKKVATNTNSRGGNLDTSKRRKNNNGTASRSASPEAGQQGDMSTDASESDGEEEEDDGKDMDVPYKAMISEARIQLQCDVAFVDFSGLHDKRSLQMIIPLIKPRKLVLIAGEDEETVALAEDLRSRLSSDATGSNNSSAIVFSPRIGELIDASVDTNAWTVKLSQSLIHNLQWQKVKGLGVVAITGRLEAATLNSEAEDENAKKKLKIADRNGQHSGKTLDEKSLTPVLDVVPANMASATRTTAQPLHVGDMRLADLRKIMQSSGLAAEFKGEGILLVNGMVAVRKTGTGRIELEGTGHSMSSFDSRLSSPAFFEVKKKIYEGLAVVAGG